MQCSQKRCHCQGKRVPNRWLAAFVCFELVIWLQNSGDRWMRHVDSHVFCVQKRENVLSFPQGQTYPLCLFWKSAFGVLYHNSDAPQQVWCLSYLISKIVLWDSRTWKAAISKKIKLIHLHKLQLSARSCPQTSNFFQKEQKEFLSQETQQHVQLLEFWEEMCVCVWAQQRPANFSPWYVSIVEERAACLVAVCSTSQVNF